MFELISNRKSILERSLLFHVKRFAGFHQKSILEEPEMTLDVKKGMKNLRDKKR